MYIYICVCVCVCVCMCVLDLFANSLLVTLFLDELIYLDTVKWFQVLQSNTNNSI